MTCCKKAYVAKYKTIHIESYRKAHVARYKTVHIESYRKAHVAKYKTVHKEVAGRHTYQGTRRYI
jgi:hypothetical protein